MDDAHLYQGVATALREALAGAPDLRAEMAAGCRALRLLNVEGASLVAELAAVDLLAPLDTDAFIDRAVHGAAANPYLNAFMKRAHGRRFTFMEQPNRNAVLRAATCYAVVLDRLARAMRSDWHLLDAVHQHWQAARHSARLGEIANAFERAKLATMAAGVGRVIEALRSGQMLHARNLNVLNILEATLEDVRLGFHANARAGLTLAMNRAESPARNPQTGAGPNRLAPDGNAFQRFPPLPRQWADLYSTWNLAFVSHYPNFPFFFAKLLAPQVLCYPQRPEEYLANRTLALYTHIHYEVFTRSDRAAAAKQGKPMPMTMPEPVNWADQEFTRLWAEVNDESARAYADQLYRADPNWRNRLKRGIARHARRHQPASN